jgi:hypothetical protein
VSENGRLAAKHEAKTSAVAERSSAAARTIGANFTAIVLVTFAVALAEGVALASTATDGPICSRL